jgi:hypothetical protein
MSLMRKRAELLVHVQNTNSQYTLPEIGKKIAYKANRDGVAERFPDPAVQKSIEVDLALLGYYDPLLNDLKLSLVKTAKQHDAPLSPGCNPCPGLARARLWYCCMRCMIATTSRGSRISSRTVA